MSYKLTITRTVPNPRYDAAAAERQQRGYMHHLDDASVCVPTMVDRVLEVEVTDEEFAAIKRAALEAM